MKTAAVVILAVAAAAPALAQDIENSDIPTQCVVVCSNIATVSADCDRAFERDADELACMCQAQNAQQVIPICAACIEFYDTDNDKDDDNDQEDNDAGEIRRSCGFSSTTYDPSTTYSQAAMTAATSITSGATTATGTGTTTSNAASSRLSELSSSAASATGSAASSLSSAISSASAAAQPSQTGNTGAMNTGAPAALAGAVLLAAAAWL